MHRIRWILIFISIALFDVTQSSGYQSGLSINVLQTATDTPGTVTVDLSVQMDGRFVGGLNTNSFSIDGQPEILRVEVVEGQSIDLYIVADLATGGSIDLIKNTLLAYIQNYYADGDRITFFQVIDTDEPPFNEVYTTTEALNQINQFQRSDEVTDLDPAFREILEKATDETSNPHVLLVGSYLNNTASARDGGGAVTASDIPVYVVQAHNRSEEDVASYQGFADAIGAELVNNENGEYLFFPDNTDEIRASGELDTLFRIIADNRNIYRITYRVEGVLASSEKVTRNIQVSHNGLTASRNFSYRPQILPPEVEITSTIDLNLEPVPDDEVANNRYLNPNLPVNFRINYPDGILRPIESVRAEIVDAEMGSTLLEFPALTTEQGENEQYTVEIDLSEYNPDKNSRPVTLNLTVTDEYDQQATASQNGVIQIMQIEEIAPTDEPPTAEPTPVEATATVQPLPTETTSIEVLQTPTLIDQITPLTGGIIVTLLVIIIGLALRLVMLRRSRSRQIDYSQPYPMQEQLQRNIAPALPDNQNEANLTTYGTLLADSGLPENTSIVITKREFLLGRSLDAGCDAEIPNKFVSSIHAAIITSQNGTIEVEDRGSSNGTWVNNRRIRPFERVPLRVGETLGLSRHVTLRLAASRITISPPDDRTGSTYKLDTEDITDDDWLDRDLTDYSSPMKKNPPPTDE